jgi:thiamine-phosphate pyrophosphorylase
LELPRLYAILDTAAYEARGFNVQSAAETLLAAGVRLLQYRHKTRFTEARFQEAQAIAANCRKIGAQFFMNDRVDYARLLHCGVHLGQDDLPVVEARAVAGPDMPIGLSTHNAAQLRQAAALPVDYVAIGPIFPTASKAKPDPVIGLSGIPALRSLVHHSLVAIGGIDIESALSVLDSGADSVAVISGLLPPRQGDWDGLRALAGRWVETVSVGGRAL